MEEPILITRLSLGSSSRKATLELTEMSAVSSSFNLAFHASWSLGEARTVRSGSFDTVDLVPSSMLVQLEPLVNGSEEWNIASALHFYSQAYPRTIVILPNRFSRRLVFGGPRFTALVSDTWTSLAALT